MMGHFCSTIKKFAAMLLCLALLAALPGAALAAETEASDESDSESIIDADELQALVDDFILKKNLNKDNISIGYCYTATGDTWYYNENKWYYSASMYKVPLMMILAEKEHNGELTQDSDINGLTLARAEESILVYSNNDFAHLVMNYLGTDKACRQLYQQYSDLPTEDYDPDFYDYSYFSARFMTDVMKTLYYEQERFPHIIDCLKLAQPDTYFNTYLGGKYEIAQKYGSYKEFNNTSGIIYTENPFILTVMTENMGVSGTVIADCAVLMEQYTLTLDDKLLSYQQEQEAERLQQEEEERLKAEEEEQKKLQEEAQKKAEEEQAQQEQQAAEKKQENVKRLIFAGAVLVLLVLTAALTTLAVKKSRHKVKSAAGRTANSAKRREAPEREAHDTGGSHYRPRH